MRKLKTYIVFILFLIMFPVSLFARPSVALVLSGGGARGYVHIATIKMIEKYNIPVDYVVGTSMGAIIGALYAAGYTADEMLDAIVKNNVSDAVFNFKISSTLPLPESSNPLPLDLSIALDSSGVLNDTGFISDTKVLNMLNRLLINVSDVNDFDKLSRAFRAVSVDVVTGDTVVLKDGDLTESVRTSMGIPFAFPVFEKDGHFMVDGGVKNNMPVDIAKAEFHPDIIISSDCTSSEALLEKGGGLYEKLKSRTASFSDVLNQVTSLGDVYNYTIEGIKALSDVAVFYDTTAWSTASFSEALDIIESAEEQILPYESGFEILSHRFTEEDKLDGVKPSYFSYAPPTIDRVEIEDNNRYRANVDEIFLKEFKSFEGKTLRPRVVRRLENKILTLSDFYSTSYMYYVVNKTEDGETVLTIKYDFPIFKKNQLSIMAEGLFSLQNENMKDKNSLTTFSLSLAALLRYSYMFDPLHSLDSFTLSLFLQSPLKKVEADFMYTHIFNESSAFIGYVSPYISLLSEKTNGLSYIEKNFFKERDYRAEAGVKVGYFHRLSVLTTTLGLNYTHFGLGLYSSTSGTFLKRENSLYPFIDFSLYVGDKRKKAIILDSSYRVELNGFVGLDIPCFKEDYALTNLKVPYSLEVRASGTYKMHPHVIGKLDGRFGFSSRPYDLSESYFPYGGAAGMPGFYRDDKYLDYLYAACSLLFPLTENTAVLTPVCAIKFAVGAHDLLPFSPSLSYPENPRTPFSSLSKLNMGLQGSFILSTSVVDVILSLGYEFTENKLSFSVEIW